MRWPSFDYIFFDCDSTLSTIEGIDVLAEAADKKQQVEELTNAAMDGKIDLSEVYGRRLEAIGPTRKQIHEIKNAYKKTIVEDAAEVIAALQHFGVEVFVISGGLLEPVKEFAISLGVASDNIRAVDVRYDGLSGEWWQQDGEQQVRYKKYEEGALTVTDGKADIVDDLLKNRPVGRSLLIGDGTSDMMAGRRVDLFVGFGGVVTREKVLANAPVFLHTESLAPLLSMGIGPANLAAFDGTEHEAVAKKGADLTKNGAFTFTDKEWEIKFNSALGGINHA